MSIVRFRPAGAVGILDPNRRLRASKLVSWAARAAMRLRLCISNGNLFEGASGRGPNGVIWFQVVFPPTPRLVKEDDSEALPETADCQMDLAVVQVRWGHDGTVVY